MSTRAAPSAGSSTWPCHPRCIPRYVSQPASKPLHWDASQKGSYLRVIIEEPFGVGLDADKSANPAAY